MICDWCHHHPESYFPDWPPVTGSKEAVVKDLIKRLYNRGYTINADLNYTQALCHAAASTIEQQQRDIETAVEPLTSVVTRQREALEDMLDFFDSPDETSKTWKTVCDRARKALE